MSIDPSISSIGAWLWEATAQTIYGAVLLVLLAKARKPGAWLLDHGSEKMQRLRRGARKRRLLRIRDYRFDEAWINRQVSRGHTCAAIFVLWAGGFALTLGLADIVSYSSNGEPLKSSMGTAMLASLPTYLAEIGWLYFSGRAGEVIDYRQKVKIWRFRHR